MFAKTSRRDLFKLGAGAAAFSTLAKADESSVLAGQVRCRQTGKGLSNIRVSNGRDIARTDQQGYYKIKLEPEDVAFVIKPRGYAPLLDERNLPRLHAPSGVQHFDFWLQPEDEPERFDVLLIADPQPGNQQELSFLSDLLTLVSQKNSPRFVMTLGDLIGDQPQLYATYDRLMAQLDLPIWNLPGNHDLDFSKSSPKEARALWRELYGPGTRAFEYGPALFITLDNIGHGSSEGGHYGYIGDVGADNLRFVESVLRDVPKEQLIILAMHIPLVSSAPKADLSCHTHDHQALLSLLEGRACLSLSGHMHTYEHHEIETRQGELHHHHVLNALCGSWWTGPFDPNGQPVAQSCDGTPNGWYVLSVDGAQAQLKFHAARNPSALRVMIGSGDEKNCALIPQRISCEDLPQARLFANVFAGTSQTRVAFKITGKNRQWMARRKQIDPSTQALFAAAGNSRKPWVEPIASTHLWVSALPKDLVPGFHRIDVEVFERGAFVAHSTYFLDVVAG